MNMGLRDVFWLESWNFASSLEVMRRVNDNLLNDYRIFFKLWPFESFGILNGFK